MPTPSFIAPPPPPPLPPPPPSIDSVASPTSGPFILRATSPSVPVTVTGAKSPVARKPTPSTSSPKKTPQKNRKGSPNYTGGEVTRMIYIVADMLPLGSNEWAVVAQRFNDVGDEISVMPDQDSLKKKFDKLAATKKSTGDPSCPPDVRKAKLVARDINGKAQAGLVWGSSSEEEEVESGEVGSVQRVGSPKRKREEGARGVKKRRGVGDDELVAHVESMSEAVTDLMKSITGTAGLDIDALDEPVGKRISEEMADTKRFLNEQRDAISQLTAILKSAVPVRK